jgi:hypothetical protein
MAAASACDQSQSQIRPPFSVLPPQMPTISNLPIGHKSLKSNDPGISQDREPLDGMRSVFLRLGAVLLWLATGTTLAQVPTNEPQLRVEAGMHTAVVRHVGVSPDGKRKVSAT